MSTEPESKTFGEFAQLLMMLTKMQSDGKKDLSCEEKLENIESLSNHGFLYSAFNEPMKELIDELQSAVEENEELGLAKDLLDIMIVEQPIEPLRRWIVAMDGYDHLVQEYSDEVAAEFVKCSSKMKYLQDLQMEDYWDDFDNEEKEYLWNRILYICQVADAIVNTNPKLLGFMVNTADNLAKNDDEEEINHNKLLDIALDNVLGNNEVMEMCGIKCETDSDTENVRNQAKMILGGQSVESFSAGNVSVLNNLFGLE